MKNEFIARIKSETPDWFKRIMYFGITLGTTASGLKVIFAEQSIVVGPPMDKILEYCIVIGYVAALVAKTACKETPPPKPNRNGKV